MLAILFPAPDAHAQDYAAGVSAWKAGSPKQAEQIWRKSGWQRDDYRSQFRLGELYGNPSVKAYYDPVESYVWYYLVTINKAGSSLSPITARNRHALMSNARSRRRQLFDTILSNRDRIEGQRRVIYILSRRGADGFLTLGQIHDERLLIQKDNGRRRLMEPPDRSIIVPSKRMAQIFYLKALDANHPDAEAHLKAIGKLPPPNDIVASAEQWMRPYELYPGKEYPGKRYRDYSVLDSKARRALLRAGKIKLEYVQQALKQLGFYNDRVDGTWGEATRRALTLFEERVELPPTGELTARLKVQIIQTAAILGIADAQNRLGVMYFKGIGVKARPIRAHYWFEKAAAQNHPAALYHLAVIYQAGVPGVPSDPAKANYYFTQSAYAGFKESQSEITIRMRTGKTRRGKRSGRPSGHQYGN